MSWLSRRIFSSLKDNSCVITLCFQSLRVLKTFLLFLLLSSSLLATGAWFSSVLSLAAVILIFCKLVLFVNFCNHFPHFDLWIFLVSCYFLFLKKHKADQVSTCWNLDQEILNLRISSKQRWAFWMSFRTEN